MIPHLRLQDLAFQEGLNSNKFSAGFEIYIYIFYFLVNFSHAEDWILTKLN